MSIASLDVVIVGAGPAGIGMSIALDRLGAEDDPNHCNCVVLERDRIGESFLRWPRQTRFITPSFHSNPFGLADLNAVNESSSVAIASGMEHPDGPSYARYLQMLAQAHALRVLPGCGVDDVRREPDGCFLLHTAKGELRAKAVVWATGEFQFPDLTPFPGAEHCLHYARIEDWREVGEPPSLAKPGQPSQRRVVIGGYESGVDAAIQLVALGHEVTLLARKSTWDPDGPYDPSLSLSPHSRERLGAAADTGRLRIEFGAWASSVEEVGPGRYRVWAEDGRHWSSAGNPILGTGFVHGGGVQQIASLFDWDGDGRLKLTVQDESTLTPGLFLVGPQVRQEGRIYCFVYKFRQRFEVVARALAERLELDVSRLDNPGGAWGPFGNSECCEGCEC